MSETLPMDWSYEPQCDEGCLCLLHIENQPGSRPTISLGRDVVVEEVDGQELRLAHPAGTGRLHIGRAGRIALTSNWDGQRYELANEYEVVRSLAAYRELVGP